MSPVTYNVGLFLYYDGAYHLTPRDHVSAAGVSYSRGVGDDLDIQKGTMTCRLIDDTDQYRPSNPESPLYGRLAQHLPFALLTGGATKIAGELEEISPDQSEDHLEAAGTTVRGSRWVDLTGCGPIGTIGRWRNVEASPMRLYTLGLTTLAAYWPGEDGENSDRMSSAYAAARATVRDVAFAAADGPPGSNQLLQLGSAGQIDGVFPGSVSTAGWQISWASNMLGADAVFRPVMTWRTSQGYVWQWSATTTEYLITVTDAAGTVLHSTTYANGGAGPGQHIVTRIKATRAGTTWTVSAAWWRAGSLSPSAPAAGTFTGGAGRPTTWQVRADTTMGGAYLGHVYECTGGTEDLLTFASLEAAAGYDGESSSARFLRLAAIRSLPVTVLGDQSKSALMGPQRPGTFKELLQEIQRTEFGIMYESRPGRGITFVLRHHLYEQARTPAMTITFPVDAPVKEIATAAELYNVVTAQNRTGASATVIQAAGRYGTADPPAGMGIIDKVVDVNLFNGDDLEQLANQWLRFHQEPQRFGDILLDLDAVPAITAAAEGLEIGKVVVLAGKTPDPVKLLVGGLSGFDQRMRYAITVTPLPAGVFDVSTWSGARRWGASSCTVKLDVTATQTSVTLKMTADERWSPTPGYGLMIAGERMTVTAMGARTGTAGDWQQIATVTRSANGITKEQVAGTAVQVADVGRWGW